MPFYYFWDPTYLLLIPCVILTLWAQARVHGAYRKFAQVASRRGWTASAMARRILDENGLQEVTVRPTGGSLTDHYDPRNQTLALSQGVYESSSVAALGIAAHEVGHALQYRDAYAPIRWRGALVPVANLGSSLAIPVLILGVLLSMPRVAMLSVALFGFATLFQLVTLPVEFNASRRALDLLEEGGYMEREEIPQAKKVLSAAAMTYVAALAVSLVQLLRLFILAGGRRRD